MERSLLDADALSRAAAWEELVLQVLGVTPESAPIDRWARVYADVSQQLTEDGEGPVLASSARTSSRGDALDLDAVWGLVYGARTFQIARRLLALEPAAAAGPIVDVGAGWGPFALAAALSSPGAPVELVDVSADRLDRAVALFEAAGMPRPSRTVADAAARLRLSESDPPAIVGFAYSLGELLDRGVDGSELLARLPAKLRPGGRLVVVEPGTRPASRRLQSIRDALMSARTASVRAPCTGAPTCPLLANPRDWCHFTWQLPLGPLGQRIADVARRRAREVHFSWLALARADEPEDRDGHRARLLELRSIDRGKATLRVCTPKGTELLTVLRREGELFEHLTAIEPASELSFDETRLERRGDGLRVTQAYAIRIMKSP